jgi:hypothetical protein
MGAGPEDGYWGNACNGGLAYSDTGMWWAINRKLKKMQFGYHDNYYTLDKQAIAEPK